MDLFRLQVSEEKIHPVFSMLLTPDNVPERDVLTAWASGMPDRDGKFVREFQTTFESSVWELYLHACLKELGHAIDFRRASPDFHVTHPLGFLMEATIAAPEEGGKPGFGEGPPELPKDLNEFNRLAILRLCNSFTAKERRFRDHYQNLPGAAGLPYVIAIAPFDRPAAHMAASRPIIAALYGTYVDEDETIRTGSESTVRYHLESVAKKEGVDIPVGLFATDEYRDVSAVVYTPLSMWGKVRALAVAPEKPIIFQAFHPNKSGLMPRVRAARKSEYIEHLMDGLYILHNPHAIHPVPPSAFDNSRVVQLIPRDDGAVAEKGPDDFLLMRQLVRFQQNG